MNEAIEKRQYLNNWALKTDKSKVVQIARDYPNCGCEKATAAEDGFGPVSDSEILRTLITSTYNINLKKSITKSITPAIFRRIFKDGLSTIRLEYADKTEIKFTAKELYEYQFNNDSKFGGIVGAVDFLAGLIRYDKNKKQICCILETPMENKRSHADVVSSEVLSDEQQTKLATLLFSKIGGKCALKKVNDIDDGFLAIFEPRVLSDDALH